MRCPKLLRKAVHLIISFRRLFLPLPKTEDSIPNTSGLLCSVGSHSFTALWSFHGETVCLTLTG